MKRPPAEIRNAQANPDDALSEYLHPQGGAARATRNTQNTPDDALSEYLHLQVTPPGKPENPDNAPPG